MNYKHHNKDHRFLGSYTHTKKGYTRTYDLYQSGRSVFARHLDRKETGLVPNCLSGDLMKALTSDEWGPLKEAAKRALNPDMVRQNNFDG